MQGHTKLCVLLHLFASKVQKAWLHASGVRKGSANSDLPPLQGLASLPCISQTMPNKSRVLFQRRAMQLSDYD